MLALERKTHPYKTKHETPSTHKVNPKVHWSDPIAGHETQDTEDGILLEEALEETVEEDAIPRTEFGELDAHAFAGEDTADDAVGAHGAAGNLEDQAQLGLHGRGVRGVDEDPALAQCLQREVWWSPPPYQATNMPLGREMRW